MSENALHAVYEPISISPAEPGWRAVLQYQDDEHLTIEHVIAWGVFHITLRTVTGEVAEDQGNEIRAVTGWSSGGAVGDLRPVYNKFLWYYLRPGTPDPLSLAEARSERDRIAAAQRS